MLWPVIRLISKTSSVIPDFFTFLILSYHFLPAVKVLEKCKQGVDAYSYKDLDITNRTCLPESAVNDCFFNFMQMKNPA